MPDATNITVRALALAQQKAKLDLKNALMKVCREFNEATGLHITGVEIDWAPHTSTLSGSPVVDSMVVTNINLETNLNEHVQ